MVNAIRRAMVWLVSTSMVFMGTPVYAQDTYEAALARLDTAMAELEQIRSLIDRTAFDLDALSFELFMEDAAGLEAWVSDNIVYQPYAGLLRGAEGTLMNRAGNALDQAVLLSTLMNGSGYEARIASGSLTDDQATMLLQTSEATPERDYSELRQNLAGIPGLDVDMLFDTTPDAARLGTTEDFSAAMQSAIAGAGLELGQDQPDLLADAADYYWVEYRLGSEDWTAAHPAAPFLADAGLEAESHLVDEIPAELQHRVRFEVLVESFTGDELVVAPIMPTWERPAANMLGTVISYTNVPNSDAPTITQALDESEYFVPVFMGGMPEGGKAFDLFGTLLSPEDAANPMAGVVRAVRGGFMDALGALGGMDGGDSGEALALSAQWVVVTLIAPGGQEREFKRAIFDRVGDDARDAGLATLDQMTAEEAELSLITEYRLMAFPGELPVDYLLDVQLERMLQDRDFLEYTIALQHGKEPTANLEDVLIGSSPLEQMLTMDMFNTGPAGNVSYRAEPGLLVFSDSLAGTRKDSRMVSSLDIMNNARQVISSEDNAVVALDQGVWETLTERDLLQDFQSNTTNFGTDFAVLEPGSSAPESLSASARINMQRDLDNGYAVLLPESAETWWRVNLATGETLGITRDGRGQAATEYAIQGLDQHLTLIFAIKSYDDCQTGDASFAAMEAQLCCLMKAHMSNVIGLGLGGALSKSLGGLAGTLASLEFTIVSGITGADLSPDVGIC